MDLTFSLPKDGETYGLPFLKQSPNQLMRELVAYRLTRGRHGAVMRQKAGIVLENTKLKSPTQHMVNAMQMLWPTEVVFKSRGKLNFNIIDLLIALNTHDTLGIAGYASSGKTWGMSAWINTDWMAAPECTSTWVASTTLGSSEDRIYGAIATLYKAAKKRCEEKFGGSVGHLIDYRRMIIFENPTQKDDNREYRNAIKALAFETGNLGEKAVEETRGRKNKRVRVFIDELAEMEPYVLKVRANLASNKDFVFVGTANPSNKALNPHKELCTPKLGWETVTKDDREWETETGHCLFLSGERNPNFQAPRGEPDLFEGLLSWDELDAILKSEKGNTNSYEYLRNAVGFWPDSSVELTVLDRKFIAASKINYIPVWKSEKRPVCGFDCAFTSGGDRNCASFGQVGTDDSGRVVSQYLGTKVYHSKVGEVYEESIAKQVVADCINAKVKPVDFGMDISGDGGKMLQAIIKEWLKFDPTATEIYPISSMGPPTDHIVSQEDKRSCKEAFDRLITEYWFWMRNAIGSGVLLGLDLQEHSDVIDELVSRQYSHKGKKVAVETKAEIKKRIMRSIDLADSFAYYSIMSKRAGVAIVQSEKEDEVDEEMKEYFANLPSNFDDKKSESEEDFAYAGTTPNDDYFY